MNDTCDRFLVSVVLPDRVGILRDVSGALFSSGANISDLRQGVMGGIFTMHAIAEFPRGETAAAVEIAVRKVLNTPDAAVSVLPCRASDALQSQASERYVAAVTGPDRPGRIHEITKIFADAGVNVEDWRHDFSDPERTLTIGIVSVPAGCNVSALVSALRAALAPTGLSTSLLHENIFRATNEVGPIAALLGSGALSTSRNAP